MCDFIALQSALNDLLKNRLISLIIVSVPEWNIRTNIKYPKYPIFKISNVKKLVLTFEILYHDIKDPLDSTEQICLLYLFNWLLKLLLTPSVLMDIKNASISQLLKT